MTKTGPASDIPQPLALPDLVFNDQGLIPVIVQRYDNGEVLMLAWMDATAIRRTITDQRATYFSRSRHKYWVKGETSGHFQHVKSLHYDCDGDTLLLQVDQVGAACHTGTPSCFTGRIIARNE